MTLPDSGYVGRPLGPVKSKRIAKEVLASVDRCGTVCWRDAMRLGLALGRENAGKILTEQDAIALVGQWQDDGLVGFTQRLRNDPQPEPAKKKSLRKTLR